MVGRIEFLVVGAAAALATFGLAVAQAQDVLPRTDASTSQAQAEQSQRVTTTGTPSQEPANCGRKVKIVYPGYGEADRVGCSTPR